MKQVLFLRHIISKDSVVVDLSKVAAIMELKQSKNVTEVKVCRTWRLLDQFFMDFSTIAIPLTSLTKRKIKFTWDEACEKSFQTLKECQKTALVLTFRQGVEGFVIYINACNQGYGIILMQNDKVVA